MLRLFIAKKTTLPRPPRPRVATLLMVFAMMGGIEIKVPPDWNVNADITPIMGGMEDKTQSSERSHDKKLTLRGFVMMGGIEVHN